MNRREVWAALRRGVAGLLSPGEIRLTPGESRRTPSSGDRGRRGERAEEAACRHLRGLGYKILCRDRSNAVGELDIVALEGQTVVFAEVRSRGPGASVPARDTLTPAKRRTLARAAELFLRQHRMTDRACRVDLLAVEPRAGERSLAVEHLKSIIDVHGR